MSSDFSVERAVKATRKAHTCNHCLCTIEAGRPMNVFVGRQGDYWFHTRCHPECVALSRAIDEGYGDEVCWNYEIAEDIIAVFQPEHWVAVGYVKRTNALARLRGGP